MTTHAVGLQAVSDIVIFAQQLLLCEDHGEEEDEEEQ